MSNGPGSLQRWRLLDRVERGLRLCGLNDYALLLLLAGMVGAATGCGVILFRATYEGLTRLFLPGADGHHVLEALRAAPPGLVVGVAAGGGLLVGLIHRFALRGGEFHGVATVLHAVAFVEGRIPSLTTAVRFVTNALSIAVGGSVGPEGPVIELGAGLGSSFAQVLRLSPERMRTLVGAGAAAGLAAAFNAPIAGAIFALEIVLKDFAVVTFSPIIVASVLATAISRSFLGDSPAFPVPDYQLQSMGELPLYLLLGVLAGLWGPLFSHSLRRGERWCTRLPWPRPLSPMIGGALLGLLVLALPELFGVGYEPIVELLHGDLGWKTLLLLLVAKLMATDITLASGFAGGIFAPILFMGGALGGLVGLAGAAWSPGPVSAPGAYALVGMAALMAAVTHAPITAILILFEMTGGYEVILPLMLSCIAAVAVAQAISRDSAFTLGFREKGLEINYGRESAILRNYFAEDLMHPAVAKVRVNTPFGEILDRFFERRDERWYVVDAEDRLVGVIDIHDIKSVLQEQGLRWVVIAADVMHPVERSVARRENLEEVIAILSASEEDELPVVDDPHHHRLVGTISRADILELYNREILHRDVLGIKLVHEDTHGTDYVGLPAEYKVDLIDVDARLARRTLAQLDLRGRYGVHVIAIKRPGQRAEGRNELPDPNEPLQRRDRLIVVGHAEDLERLKHDPEL